MDTAMTDREKLVMLAGYLLDEPFSFAHFKACREQHVKLQNDCTHDGTRNGEEWDQIRGLLNAVQDLQQHALGFRKRHPPEAQPDDNDILTVGQEVKALPPKTATDTTTDTTFVRERFCT